MNCFVTGTDTGVGKTFFAALLVRALRAAGIDAVGFKPVCCGSRADARALSRASGGGEPIDRVNPVWVRAPAAPLAAARAGSAPVPLDKILNVFDELRHTHRRLVVEGVGGWLVPLAPGVAVADLAARLALPVLVVAENRLGALNHTLLTVAHILACGQRCLGVVLNTRRAGRAGLAGSTNASLLRELLPVPLLWEIAPGQSRLELPAWARRRA